MDSLVEAGDEDENTGSDESKSSSFAAAAALVTQQKLPKQQVFKCGWLDKLGGAKGGRKSWKKRYFELVVDAESAVLIYFKDHHRENKKGEIDLEGCNCSMLSEFSDTGKGCGSFRKVGGAKKGVPKDKQLCGFVLTHPSRRESNRVFTADIPAAASEWVFLLRRATSQINATSQATPQEPIQPGHSISGGRRLSSHALIDSDGSDSGFEESGQDIEGELHVKAQGEGALKRRNWRKCHCSLKAQTLTIHEGGAKGKLWKERQLKLGVSCSAVESKNHENTFQITDISDPDALLNLFADSAAEREKWIFAIAACVERLERFTT
jgi:hypothetical protein